MTKEEFDKILKQTDVESYYRLNMEIIATGEYEDWPRYINMRELERIANGYGIYLNGRGKFGKLFKKIGTKIKLEYLINQ